MKNLKKKPFGVGNGGIRVDSDDRIDAAALRNRAQAEPKAFAREIHDLAHKPADGEEPFSWRNVRNVKALQDALADVQVPVYDASRRSLVTSSAFPVLTSTLTVAGVNEAYMAVPTIGQELVMEMDDNKKTTNIVGITSEDGAVDRVDEGKPFPLVGAGEEKFSMAHKRNGRRMVVTQEMIEENDLAGILQRVNALGEIAAELIEEQTIRRVYDIDGSAASAAEPYVLHLNGAAASMYSTTANTPGTRTPSGNRINNNALVDTDSLETARVRLTTMLNSRGKKIQVLGSDVLLVVPDALWLTAWKLLNSTFEPGVFNEANFFGDSGPFRPRIVSSTKIDALTTTVWLLGAPARQFTRKWKLRPETVVLPGTAEGAAQSFLDARIGFQARVAWDMEVGARDYVYVVQNLPATTAP